MLLATCHIDSGLWGGGCGCWDGFYCTEGEVMWSMIPHIPVVNLLLTGGNCPLPQQMTVNLSSFIFSICKKKGQPWLPSVQYFRRYSSWDKLRKCLFSVLLYRYLGMWFYCVIVVAQGMVGPDDLRGLFQFFQFQGFCDFIVRPHLPEHFAVQRFFDKGRAILVTELAGLCEV